MPLVLQKQQSQRRKTPHLALCHESQGFSANNRPVSLLMKSSEFSEEIKKAFAALGYDISKMYMNEKREKLQSAISEKYADEDDWLYVEDFDDSKAIFCCDEGLYSIEYEYDGESFYVGDEATPVSRGIVYNEEEGKAELTPEAEEDMDEDVYNMVVKALSNPNSYISEVFKVTKKEGDETLSASAFAYVPDKESPSTWKLRIDDANHTRAAVAALGKGFRGNKVDIPSEDLPAVKRKVKAAYKKFFPDEKELPEILKSNEKEITLKEEIQKAVEEVQSLFKAQLEEKDAALNKALEKLAELEKGAVLKAREEALSFVTEEASRKELVKSLESLSDEAFAVVVKNMKTTSEAVAESDLMKQLSQKVVVQEQHEADSFDAMMKAKYGKQ